MSIAISLHLLAAIVWVGGMFFAYMSLRPAAAVVLDPPLRLPLWTATFNRFFPWVWVSVSVLLATGYWMMFAVLGGFSGAPAHVHAMNGIGLVMMALFAHLFFVPFRRMKRGVSVQDWPEAARNLNQIKWIVATNLTLGLITSVIAVAGRY